MPESKTLIIVWHSRTGASEQMADCAARSAKEAEPGVIVTNQMAATVDALQLLSADAYLFVCPENLASMSGEMKEFFDRNYYDCLDRLNGRPYSFIVCAGSDGQGAARQIERIATGWRLKMVAEPLIINTGAQLAAQIIARKTTTAEQRLQAADMGAGLAAGLALGVY